jgi:hypothetical protein
VLIRSPVVSEQPRRRAEETPWKYIAGDGDRLRDLVATSSELRHCPTFAVPARSWSSMVAVGSTSRLYASRYRPSTDLPRPVMYVELSRGHPVPHVMKVASHSVGRSVKFPHREKSRRPSLLGNGSAVACRLSEITAIANKMRQGRSSASASGNQLLDGGSSLMIWRSVVKTPVKARMLSDTEAIILASAILGVAWLALT